MSPLAIAAATKDKRLPVRYWMYQCRTAAACPWLKYAQMGYRHLYYQPKSIERKTRALPAA